MAKLKPHYDLLKAQALIKDNKFIMVKTAKKTAFALGFNQERIKDVLLNLRRTDFSKSEPDWQIKGHWQDAYKTLYEGQRLYIKWKIIEHYVENLLVLSFKEEEEK